MTEANTQQAAEAPRTPEQKEAEDLSAQIVKAVKSQTGDVVRCTRISGDKYRCNWWAASGTGGYDNPGMAGLLVTTHRVRKSQFLRVTKTAGRGLEIRVVSTDEA